jgi:hypothetical protein
MALHPMGAVPKWREGVPGQRKRVIPHVRFGGSRLNFEESFALGCSLDQASARAGFAIDLCGSLYEMRHRRLLPW